MQHKTVAIVASLVILVAGISLWRTIGPVSSSGNRAPLIGIGQVLAEETAKTVHDRGRVIAVIPESYQEPDNPLHATWEAFRTELKKHAALSLAATEIVKPDPVEGLPGCSTHAFQEILERHRQADVIVFFMGLPNWHWLQATVKLPESVPCKIIVMHESTMSPKSQYEGYFSSGLLSVLMVGNWGGGPEQVTNPKTPRQWFDKAYRIFTPQNYESLPE